MRPPFHPHRGHGHGPGHRHGHGHGHGPGHGRPGFRGWIGDRLHRQLFATIAVSIVLSVATVVGVYRLLGEGHGSWQRSVARVQRVIARRLAADWHDPAARAADVRDLSEAIGGGVRVADTDGSVLHAVGWEDGTEGCHWDHTLTVEGSSGALGTVTMCLDAQGPRFQPWVLIAALFAAIGVLWLMAGIVARRIAWPLRELTRVARDLGEGRLASRVRLRHGRRGEVGELTRAINDMAGRIERQVKSQQELLAAVSHEMRTPLARVRLLVDIGRDKPERADVLDQIDGEAVQMDSLVGELLAASRLDFGAFSARELDPMDLAERAWERAAIPDGGVEVAGDPGKMQGDATLLARALTAVLDNAHKHGGGKTTLRVRGTPERVLFEVDDEGPGFAPGDEERIFEPFYGGRTVPEGEPGRGTGIGLALVRRIAEAHGGRAFAARREPRGARITIELPRG